MLMAMDAEDPKSDNPTFQLDKQISTSQLHNTQHSGFVSFFPAIGFSIYQWLSPIDDSENSGDTEIYQAKG